jgi:multimeric flavodoxin WrbA
MRLNYGDPFPMGGKIGAAIACGNWRNGWQELTIQNIQTFFLQMNMQVIGDGPSFATQEQLSSKKLKMTRGVLKLQKI